MLPCGHVSCHALRNHQVPCHLHTILPVLRPCVRVCEAQSLWQVDRQVLKVHKAPGAIEPVLTTFVLPWWDDKGSSYARWLSHQTVQAIATIDRSKFRFDAPRHWADEQEQWCTPKRNVHFLIVANEAGLQHYVKQDKLNKKFACPSQLGNPPQRPKQLKMTIQQTVSPPGLYPPKHYYIHSLVTWGAANK